MNKRPLVVLALGAALISGTAALVAPAIGTAQQPPAGAPAPDRAHERPLPSRHVEGRIAFLRAELRITAAQQPQWDLVASTMRANAQRMDQLVQEMRGGRDQPQSALERLDRQSRLVEARAAAVKSFADAFRPLYQVLTDDQRKSADELFEHHGRRGGWRL